MDPLSCYTHWSHLPHTGYGARGSESPSYCTHLFSRHLHGARPVHQIISMIRWIRTSRLSRKKTLSQTLEAIYMPDYGHTHWSHLPQTGYEARGTEWGLTPVLDCFVSADDCLAPSGIRCGTNSAHARQSRPDSGLGFQVKVLTTFVVVPSSLGSGRRGSGSEAGSYLRHIYGCITQL